jgi:molybdopterin/thiamine biosynthesis adenylyltransferase
MDYRELFQRNYGIFSEDEQERLRRAKVLIVGCGGIGGTVAVILARSGVERFVLCDFDVYSPTNMNRQIACFADTLGRKKTEVVRETILRINPAAEVTAYTELLPHARIAELMGDADFVFPAADDLAFSIIVFRDAQRLGKPALMVYPAGTWAHVSVILPGAPSIEEIEGVPKLGSYEALRDMLEVRRYKLATYFYVLLGDWRIDYYRGFIEENFRPTQICPIIWLSSCIGAFEVLKVLSGKWEPVASPRYWEITAKRVRIRRMNGPSLHTLLVWQRRLMWRIFQSPFGPALEWMQGLWWALFQRWMRSREEKRERTAGVRGIGRRA